jgi:hypothetical protein
VLRELCSWSNLGGGDRKIGTDHPIARKDLSLNLGVVGYQYYPFIVICSKGQYSCLETVELGIGSNHSDKTLFNVSWFCLHIVIKVRGWTYP